MSICHTPRDTDVMPFYDRLNLLEGQNKLNKMERDMESSIVCATSNGDFVDIRECEKDRKLVSAIQAFTMAQIINYFIEAVAGDKENSKDFKSI